MTIGDTVECIRVLLDSDYTSITGLGVHLMCSSLFRRARPGLKEWQYIHVCSYSYLVSAYMVFAVFAQLDHTSDPPNSALNPEPKARSSLLAGFWLLLRCPGCPQWRGAYLDNHVKALGAYWLEVWVGGMAWRNGSPCLSTERRRYLCNILHIRPWPPNIVLCLTSWNIMCWFLAHEVNI